MSDRPTKLLPLRPKGLRLASSVEDGGFPYRGKTIAYVVVTMDGEISNPQYVGERRSATEALRDGQAQVFAVWPGQYRSDLFVIDDPKAFSAAYCP
jgi:hypothetical protein